MYWKKGMEGTSRTDFKYIGIKACGEYVRYRGY